MSDIAKAAGISRQALYLHFPNRTDLLVAATRHIDAHENVQTKLAATRAAKSGRERLALWVDVWGNYIPVIYGVAKALMAMQENDTEAGAAWADRMSAMREGCEAAVAALASDGDLSDALTTAEAVDLLWTLLSVRSWESLTKDCGWDQERYVEAMKVAAARALTA